MSNVALVPVSWDETDPEALMQVLIRVVLALPVKGVVLVVDTTGPSGAAARKAYEGCSWAFAEKGLFIEVHEVTCPDTGERWLEGLKQALTLTSDEDRILVVPGDMRQGLEAARDAYQKACASSAGLVVIDYESDPISQPFKAGFDAKVLRPILRVLWPSQAAIIEEMGIEHARSECFALSVSFLRERLRDLQKGGLWPSDPTVALLIAALTTPGGPVEVVQLGRFGDADASRQHPSGLLPQILRLASQQMMIRARADKRRTIGSTPEVQWITADRLRVDINRCFVDAIEPALAWAMAVAETDVKKKREALDRYAEDRGRLMALLRVAECDLDVALPGRKKYSSDNLAPLPFPGISVIHDIRPHDPAGRNLHAVCADVVARVRAAKQYGPKIATVAISSLHVTTFDLVNRHDHSTALSGAGFDYERVRGDVERATKVLLEEWGSFEAPVVVTGLGMFSPGVLKLNIELDQSAFDRFQALRRALNARLCDAVPGYPVVRGRGWGSPLSGHITVGYVVKPLEEQEVDALMKFIKEYNDAFALVEFCLARGNVMAFSDMDTYGAV